LNQSLQMTLKGAVDERANHGGSGIPDPLSSRRVRSASGDLNE
jgi:hypothetical protein